MSNGTPFAPIADDEAPTAFYRRRRRDAAAPPQPLPSPSPPTLLLPTSEARDVTSDGTILAPRQESEAEAPLSEGDDAWARLARGVREAVPNVDGNSALTGVVAFAFFGLLGVAYVFVATSAARPPVTAEGAGTGVAGQGAVARALELGLRLRRAHGNDDAEVRHAP